MKLPKSVRIQGVEYPVRFVENLNDGIKLAYGHIDFDNTEILLNKDAMSHEMGCVVLIHEIIHGLINNAEIQIENEEQVVIALSRGLYQVLQDNGRRLFDISEGGDARDRAE